MAELKDILKSGDVDGIEMAPAYSPTTSKSVIDKFAMDTALAGKADTAHTHVEGDITGLDKYTQAEVDSALGNKVNLAVPLVADNLASLSVTGQVLDSGTALTDLSFAGHTHIESQVTDLDKYTKAEVDASLALKSDDDHAHVKADITDFVETDYATGAEGDLATSALQNITAESIGSLLDVDLTGVADNKILKWSVDKLVIADDISVDISGKADKVVIATDGNFAGLDATGNLTDSGSKANDFAALSHAHLEADITDLDKYTQSEVDGLLGTVQVDADRVVVTPSVSGQIDQQSLNVVLDEQVALRETAATGIVSGGLLTIASPTTVDISAGEGEIVDGYNDRRDPTRINVSWLAIPGVTVTIVSNVGLSYFAIDNLGTLIQQPTPLTPAQRRIMVPIGVVYYNDSVVSAVIQGGVHSNEVGNALYDYVNTKSVSERVTGMGVNPVIGLLQVWSDSGELFAIGINTGISLTDPNIKSFIQVGNSTTPLIFDVLTQDGAVFSTGNTTIPALLELTPNVVTPLGVTPAAIHYLYRDINNEFFLQLGQIEYPNVGAAKASLSVDATTFVNFTGQESMILVAQIYMKGNASDFDNGEGGINTAILSGGSSGGVSVTDFLDLSDVIPTSYLGEGSKSVIVDPTETGLSFIDSSNIVWAGNWAETAYEKNVMATDSGYLGITNKPTTDRLAPQEIGAAEWGIDPNTVFNSGAFIGVVKAHKQYTITKTGWLKNLQVKMPGWTLDGTETRITYTVGDSTKVKDNPILSSSGEWTTLGEDNIFVKVGDVIAVDFEMYHTIAANKVEGGWLSNIGTGIPVDQTYNISNSEGDGTIVIDHTDLDSIERTSELRGVAVGSIITLVEEGDTARSTTIETTSSDTTNTQIYSTFTYILIDVGVKGGVRSGQITTVSIDVPITIATDYFVLAGGYATDPTWATLDTSLFYDGADQVAPANDAYGINIEFQEATISEDWDILSSGEGSSAVGLPDAPSNGLTYGRKDGAWVETLERDVTAMDGGAY